MASTAEERRKKTVEARRAWRAAHPEESRARVKAYRAKYPERFKAQRQAYQKKYAEVLRQRKRAHYLKTRAAQLAQKKVYTQANAAMIYAKNAAWRKAHPEKAQVASAKRRALKAHAPISQQPRPEGRSL